MLSVVVNRPRAPFFRKHVTCSHKRPFLHRPVIRGQTATIRTVLTTAHGGLSQTLAETRTTTKSSAALKKHALLSGIFFSNLFVYTVVRDLKDVIFITECGASYIPFVKTWINLPTSFGFIYIYNRLLNRFSFERTYCILYAGLVAVYSILGLCLYPIRYLVRVHNAPLLLENWVTTMYYVLSPIWGTIVVSVLFWSFANRYTSVDDAKRIYPIMGIVANVALILGGLIMHASGTVFAHDWNRNVQALTLANLGMSVLAMVLFAAFTRTYTPVTNTASVVHKKRTNKKFKDNVLELGRNPFVRNMVVMISSYGLLVGFYESIWKHYLKLYLPSPIVYSKFMAAISFCTGVFTIGLMAVMSYWLERVSWLKLALITPVAMLGFGSVFFMSVQTGSIVVVSFVGAALTVFLKGAKYSLFDPCKEIAYIPMDEEIKTRGKATIEILSAPIGKSGSNCILQILVVLLGSLESGASIVGVLYVLTAVYWMHSTKDMAKLMETTVKDAEKETETTS